MTESEFDLFISYARADNADGWITQFVEQLVGEHERFTGGRRLRVFFDKETIRSGNDWRHRIAHGVTGSGQLLAFISPAYFASEWCCKEWRLWIDTEIAKHILTDGATPIYIVNVPGLMGNPELPEREVAQQIAKLRSPDSRDDEFEKRTARVVHEFRRRNFSDVQPFYTDGLDALRRDDLTVVLQSLARDLDEKTQHLERAAQSETTVPPYNRHFTGRLDELLTLRERLCDDRTGVIHGIGGLGGIGKTELAFTYAHAFAGAYPGGRFLVSCENRPSLRIAMLRVGDFHAFHEQITDEDRMTPDSHFAAILRCLDRRLNEMGHILIVLDNVTDVEFLARAQTDEITALGSNLHLLATTRLAAPAKARGRWLTLGELTEDDSVELLARHRSFENEEEAQAARRIAHRLGGFALAVELVAAYLAAHSESTTYAHLESVIGLDSLHTMGEDADVELRRHNHEKRLSAVLAPVLETLTPAERRTVEYAAFLPPDHVALPWLKELVCADFPELAESSGLIADPWKDLWQRLLRLAVFVRDERETTEPKLVRMHRLLQEWIRGELAEEDRAARQQAIDELIKRRNAALHETTRWQEARWELEPFEAMALLWDESDHAGASWLLNQAGLRLHDVAEWSRAEPLYRRALAIDEASYGPDDPHVATPLNNLAALLHATNRFAEAEPLFRRALSIDESTYGPGHPDVARDLNNLSTLLQATNRLKEAEPLCRGALAILEASYGSDHSEVATCLNSLALLLKSTNRLTEAETLYRRALAIDEASYGPDHPTVATDLNNLAELLRATNRFTEAEPLYRRALAIDEASDGFDHPNVARDLNNLAILLQATNRLTEAEPLYRRALAIDEASYGENDPHVAIRLNNLASLLRATNRLTEAEPLYRRALAIDEASYGKDHPSVAIRLNNLAVLLHATNRLTEAEPLYRRALAIDEASYGPDDPKVAIRLNNLSGVLQATKRLKEAETLSRRQLEIFIKFTRKTGHQHPHLQTAVNNYAGLLLAMGKSDDEIRAILAGIAPEFFGQSE